MTIVPGQLLTLTVDKPAAGGWAIARHDGQVVLVSGAIPGERISARIERVRRGVAYARTMSVDVPSPDRRPPFGDPECGGCLYAHIAYPRQLDIKSQVIADALLRIGRIVLPEPVAVRASPVEGYRLRSRLHVRDGAIGFFREGSHELCDARSTRQLSADSCDRLERIGAGLRSTGITGVREIDVAENVNGLERVVHLGADAPIDVRVAAATTNVDGVTGVTLGVSDRAAPLVVVRDSPYVTDVLSVGGGEVRLRRHVLAFFQGNRFLLQDLVEHVTELVNEDAAVVDLYAGVGLFSLAAAIVKRARVTAVEGDPIAAADLAANARASAAAVETRHEPVEAFTRRSRSRPAVVIVDPPRTGMSVEALGGAIALGAETVVYVSCDVATLARDARRLLDAGYGIDRIAAFDMFPNTPHVETVVRFGRGSEGAAAP